MTKTRSLLLALCTATIAHAHPGHGSTTADAHSIVHYVTEPTHAIGFLAGVAVMILIASVVIAKRRNAIDA